MNQNHLPRPQLVTFDFGDTLVTSEPPYLARVARGLNEIGFPVSREAVEAAFHQADLEVCSRLGPGPFAPRDYIHGLRDRLFDLLQLEGNREKAFQDLTEWLLSFKPRRVLIPGAQDLLEYLRGVGVHLGIISNNDGSTREKCASVGIDRYFEFILDSTLEQVMKPDRRLFAKALTLAGVPAGQALHVGDLWGSDVLGAHWAGMHAAWLANDYINPQPREGTFTIASLPELQKMMSENPA